MATLPTRAAIVSATTTNAEQKVNLGDQRDFLADLLGTDSADKSAARQTLGTGPQLQAPIITTSGTSQTQTGIPAYAKKITVNVLGMSASGTSPIEFRLGTSGGPVATGYAGAVVVFAAAPTYSIAQLSTGVALTNTGDATQVFRGKIAFDLSDAATNTWSFVGNLGRTDANLYHAVSGTVSLPGLADRVIATTAGGVNTFDAGSFSVSWE